MRTSLKWIKDLVPGIEDLTPQEYLDAMTLSGEGSAQSAAFIRFAQSSGCSL